MKGDPVDASFLMPVYGRHEEIALLDDVDASVSLVGVKVAPGRDRKTVHATLAFTACVSAVRTEHGAGPPPLPAG